MITSIKTFIVYAWNFVFNHNVSPLRHIPDVKIRHLVLQILGFMWAVSFSIAIGSYTVLAASILGQSDTCCCLKLCAYTRFYRPSSEVLFFPQPQNLLFSPFGKLVWHPV